MTRKDYVKIAALVKGQRDAIGPRDTPDGLTYSMGAVAENHAIALGLADVFAADNPRFDRLRFLDACGVTLDTSVRPSPFTAPVEGYGDEYAGAPA